VHRNTSWLQGRLVCVVTYVNLAMAEMPSCTGLLTSTLTNPIWVIKTRMLSTGSRTPGAYFSFVSGVRQIWTTEGLTGFYRGFVPALFGVSHGALQFMAYEKLKAHSSRLAFARNNPASATERRGAGHELGNLDLLIISSLAKVFAGCTTYPYQVLRTRLQAYDAAIVYRGVWDATRKIWHNEGLRGFYKGLGPNLLRVLPNTWVTFLVYENTRRYLPKLGIGND
jgi:solute carrier family 25 folate transporter 32